MSIQGIVFDFNGTLFFDSHYHNAVWKQLAKELRGTPFSDEEMNQHVHGKNNEKILEYITQHTLSKEENHRLSLYKEQRYREMVMAHPETSVLAPGVTDFLQACKRSGLPITIASASIKENIAFYVSWFHLEQWFTMEQIAYDDGTFEDKVEMFRHAAGMIGCDIKECTVFEDSVSGIRFAHEAGAKSIIAIDSIHEPERFAQFPFVNTICHDFTELSFEDVIKGFM